MSDDQKRAFLAVVLSGIILFGWQYFFAPKYTTPQGNSGVISSAPIGNTNNKGGGESTAAATSSTAGSPTVPGGQEKVDVVSRVLNYQDKYQFELTNYLDFINIKNEKEKFPFSSILDSSLPLEIQILSNNSFKSVPFEILSGEGSLLKGENKEMGLNFQAQILENGKLNYRFTSLQPTRLRFIIHSQPKEISNRPSREFLILSDSVERMVVGKENRGEVQATWFGVDFNYHLFAVTFLEKKSVTYKTDEAGNMVVETNNESADFNGNIVFVKKNYDDLVALGENLNLAVDFGILGVLAVPILKALQFLYDFIPNYGWAIIILTILMKILTFPLQHKSYKSMKKMQAIQPELAKLKELYKDDPQRIQKESMELFKKAGANPLSGCLPLLLQTPIFFAFYQVLYSAVELVGAPFFGWIHDLSLKDPFYVLPVVMTAVMFVQQKMTPNTSTDPTQRKVMMFMPLIFGLIMKDLPSGLTLYILVSTVCGIIQQAFVYKFTPN